MEAEDFTTDPNVEFEWKLIYKGEFKGTHELLGPNPSFAYISAKTKEEAIAKLRYEFEPHGVAITVFGVFPAA